MGKLNRELRQRERIYNTVRPISPLASSLPASFRFSSYLNERIESVTHRLDD